MKQANKSADRVYLEALIQKIGNFAVDCVEGSYTSEQDLLDMDELLVELRDHRGTDAKTRSWADRLLTGIGKRLDTGDYDA
tara:strand:- start:637 stop:879 length:243 start_codon:yes stop_codon:yes gene_type:complete